MCRMQLVRFAPCLVALLAPVAALGAEVIAGDILVGVDRLGRVLIAVDEQPLDGRLDVAFLFTHEDRIGGGPWQKRGLGELRVRSRSEALVLSLRSTDLVVSLGVEGHRPPPLSVPGFGSEVLAFDNGKELARYGFRGNGQAMDVLTTAEISTWPPAFEYDLIAAEARVTP